MNQRWRLTVTGTVQGVGFRPFVYRLAMDFALSGWVVNSAQGATIEVEGPPVRLATFVQRLHHELPAHAAIERLSSESIACCGETGFHIDLSESSGLKTAAIPPDLAVCPDCLREMRDPLNRRYRYPFINCAHCGPRYSIIQAVPYDRASTTMRGFELCPDCRAEYDDPLDRRFHAQPIACPVCGPQLALWDCDGTPLMERDNALLRAASALSLGRIVAVKGLGGFHLLADARSEKAVAELRRRKRRYEKPLAVMFPSLPQLEQACEVSETERALLCSAAAPIVLLRQKPNAIAPLVAPETPYLGAMLPYTPLHHLLLQALDFPVVATSGNRSGEPICIDEHQAVAQLGEIADFFLVHNRPIARPIDDSVVFVAADSVVTVRRARGYAPEAIPVPGASGLIAVGAQQKNTVAIAQDDHVILSQHLGDLDSAATVASFERTVADLQQMRDLRADRIVCDLHPDYQSTRFAEQLGLPVTYAQHHYAHVLACMAEHQLEAPVLGVAWDGTGYGTDGTIWGSEFLRVDAHSFTRVAHLRPFPLPGGDVAAKEPRRSALGVLYALFGRDLPRERLPFSTHELETLLSALDHGVNAPLTTSMGRLFDAVASLTGLRQASTFEGQAGMALEYAAAQTAQCYPYDITPVTDAKGGTGYILEWDAMIRAILDDDEASLIAAHFHNTLVAMLVAVAERVGEPNVLLTGGCFQNRRLLEGAINGLRDAGFHPYWPQRIPINDGGIALGQIVAAVRERQGGVCVSPSQETSSAFTAKV